MTIITLAWLIKHYDDDDDYGKNPCNPNSLFYFFGWVSVNVLVN